MRISEIICEDALDAIIEDEANDPVIMYLIEVLESIRERSHNLHQIPRVRVGSLIKLIQLKHPQFNLDILDMAKSNNNIVKGMIKDIKDDPNSGEKYLYVSPLADELEAERDQADVEKSAQQKSNVVDNMASQAAKKRSNGN